MKRHSKDKDRCITKQFKKTRPFKNRIKKGKIQAKKKISNRVLARRLVLIPSTRELYKNQSIH
jgi:hypothetical protein